MKWHHACSEKTNQMKIFLTEHCDGEKERHNIFQVLENGAINLEFYIQWKYFRKEEQIMTFSKEEKLRGLVTSKSALKIWLKEIL